MVANGIVKFGLIMHGHQLQPQGFRIIFMGSFHYIM